MTREEKKAIMENYALSIGKTVKYVRELLSKKYLTWNESGCIVQSINCLKQARHYHEDKQRNKRHHSPTSAVWRLTHKHENGRWQKSEHTSERSKNLRGTGKR
jgi:hypothetical protein